ncbi:MAG TPA: hydrogenase expression/formation C-terminal domain-containing protein [Gallionellaceae bacterium]|nr:hydrogenase expression/formation C-terminal domain-containing protein [Gallionellaceae bacterium]
MSLQNISIKVESNDASTVGNIAALLAEIASLLEVLLTTDAGSVIDLKSLPLSPQEYEQLRFTLGQGEVTARLEAIGPSEIIETQYPGVWWVTHYNVEGDIIADIIEIARIPSVLQSQTEDMQASLVRLQNMLKEHA